MRQNTRMNLETMTIAAMLIAIAIVIPMFAPKIVLEPASFTLASHVPIFIALFISPPVAVAVALGSTVGFLVAGFPIVIVLRALSHLVFVLVGMAILKRTPHVLSSFGKSTLFGFLLAFIHAVSEVAVVTLFYFGTGMSKSYYEHGYITSVILLVGAGTVVHSMVDFGIAVFVWKPLLHVIRIPVSAQIAPKKSTSESVTE